MSDSVTTLGARLRLLRTQRGMTMKQVAVEAGLGPGGESTICRIEKGGRKPGSGLLERLLEIFGPALVMEPAAPKPSVVVVVAGDAGDAGQRFAAALAEYVQAVAK